MTQRAATDSDTRTSTLAETFVMLADTLVADYDVVELLDRLVNACVTLFGVSAVGLLLDDQRGNLSVIASSSEESRLLEVFQLNNDEGPCMDCVRTGEAVSSVDLAADVERWPVFVPAAVDAGYRTVTAVPLRLRDQRIGGLNMFGAEGEGISDANHSLAQALADVATIGILQRRSTHRSNVVAEQLQHALNSRVVIEQAKGVLAERHGVAMEAAFGALRRHARNNNLKLTDVAMAVVRGDIEPGAISPLPG
jgi:GAF domain-containing protein